MTRRASTDDPTTGLPPLDVSELLNATDETRVALSSVLACGCTWRRNHPDDLANGVYGDVLVECTAHRELRQTVGRAQTTIRERQFQREYDAEIDAGLRGGDWPRRFK